MTVSVTKHINQKLFIFCKVVFAVSLLALLTTCGGGNGEPNVEPRCDVGGVSIDEPTYKDTYTASSDLLRLGGTAPLASDYVTGSSDPGVTVTWYNKATGNSGTAIGLARCGTTFLGTFCSHEWSAGIGLSAEEDNHIEVSAHENGEFVGRDCITVTYAPYEPAILPLWVKQFGTAENDTGCGIAVDANDNSYITGFTQEQGYSPNIHGFIAKYDASGNQLWTKNDFTAGSAGCGIDVDANGNSYISGYSITKYDTSGNQLWTKNDFTVGYGIAVDANGTSYIAGSTNQDLGGGGYIYPYPWESDVIIAKYDTSGNQLWMKQFGTSNPEVGRSIAIDANGNSYITGYTDGDLAGTGNAGSYDAFIAKYDTSGNQLWIKQYGTSSYDETIDTSFLNDDIAYGIAVDSNGNSYITGYTEKGIVYSTSRQYDVFIAKYDTSGNQLWIKELFTSGDYNEIGYGIAVDANGNSYITGYTEGNLAGTGNAGGEGYDVFIAKVDTNGNQVWIRQYGTSNADKGRGIAVDANGNSYVTGHTVGDLAGTGNAGYKDVFIMALSP